MITIILLSNVIKKITFRHFDHINCVLFMKDMIIIKGMYHNSLLAMTNKKYITQNSTKGLEFVYNVKK